MNTKTLFGIFSITATLAMNGQGQIYVANFGSGTIGEYNLDGSTVNVSLVSGLNAPFGLAVSGGYIFAASRDSGTIGEYNLDGSAVNASLVSGLNEPVGIAVSGGYIFVTITRGLGGCGTIGEYTTAGATVNAALVSDCAKLAYPSYIACPEDISLSGWWGMTRLANTTWMDRRSTPHWSQG